jgi:RNA polymerase sigma-70 factor (ECF subfamily)
MFMFRKNRVNLTEAELIQKAQSDSAYFEFLYEQYFEKVYRFVFKRLSGNEEISGELTQITFIKAMHALPNYEDRGFAFSSWLIRIAQNEINMYFRKLKKNFHVDVHENQLNQLSIELESEQTFSQEQQEKLVDLLNSLPEDKLDLIELRFFNGLSFKEIAEIYQITEANAKMKIYRIIEKLKEQV